MTAPAFDTRNWTLRVGDSDPIELMDRVSDCGFTRGPHGPGELHATLPLDWSPLLPVEAQIARKSPVELSDGPVRLWAGVLEPPVPDVAAQTLELSGHGILEEGNQFPYYGLIETNCNYGDWLTDLVSRTVTNTKYECDTNNRLRITLPGQRTVNDGAYEELFYMLPPWITWAYILGFGFDWTWINPDTAPFRASLYFRTSPKVTAGQDAFYLRSDNTWAALQANSGPSDSDTGVSLAATGTDKRAVVLRLADTSATGTKVTSKREIELVNICVGVRSTTKQRVDQIIGHVLTDTGMATTVNVPAGDPLLTSDPLDTFAKAEQTTPSDVCASAAAMNPAPVEWKVEAGVADIRTRPTSPPSRERTFVAYIAPAADDQCSCSGEAIVTDGDQGFYDFVALTYLCKGDAVYPDGVEMVTLWPASPAPALGDRILPATYPQEANVTEAVASAFAQQLLELTQVDAPYGDVPLDDYFICNVNGVPYPVSHLHEGDWIIIPDDPRLIDPATGRPKPQYITGNTVRPTGDATLHVGGAETALAVSAPDRGQKVRKPKHHHGKKRSWQPRHRRKAK